MNKQRKNSKSKWAWIIGGGVILLVAAALWLRGRMAGFQAAQAQTGDIVAAFIGDLSASATASGQIVAQREAALSLTTSGTVAEVAVAVGDQVEAGEVLLRLEMAELQRAVTSAEQGLIIQQANLESLLAAAPVEELAAAEAAVASAFAALADLLAGPDADEIAAAEADVRAANAEIASASAGLNSATAAGNTEEIRAAEIALELAQQAATTAAEQHSTILVTDNDFISAETLAEMELSARLNAMQANADLAAAQETYDNLVNGDVNAVAGAQASVSLAVANRDAAQAQLDLLLQGPSEVEIAEAEAQVAQAEATLDALLRGPSEAQIAQAQVAVAQAQIGLNRTRSNLVQATLTAPFAGTVTAVHVSTGELASGVLVEIVAGDSLEVVLNLDEVDIGTVVVGQTAVLTLEAWPNSEISGEVRTIAPKATDNSSGLVTYDVHLTLAETDLPVLTGMTANANLVTANRENVLLVPNAAIEVDRANGQYNVNRVQRDAAGNITTETVPVTIGLRDDQFTEIVAGLNEGDEVVIGSIAPVQQFGGPFGGGN
jgi:HlyD family secretion protein